MAQIDVYEKLKNLLERTGKAEARSSRFSQDFLKSAYKDPRILVSGQGHQAAQHYLMLKETHLRIIKKALSS